MTCGPAASVGAAARSSPRSRRERIAVDLQQIVIRNLFALGLSLQGLAGRTNRTDLRDSITAQVDEVDRIIRAIREAVFATENDTPRTDD